MGVEHENAIRFDCSDCSARLQASEAQSGLTLPCPRCGAPNRVPGHQGQPTPGPATVPQSQHKRRYVREIPVVCGVCSTRSYARAAEIGTEIECPDCGAQNEVKQPPKPKPTGVYVAPPVDDRDEYQLRDDTVASEITDSDLEHFVFFCHVCSTQMRATADQTGKSVRCPDCDFEMTVPKPPQHLAATGPIDEGPALAVGAAEQVKSAELMEHEKLRVIDSEVTAPAGLRRDYGYANDPEPPARPFATRVVEFLFYENTRANWIAFALTIAPITLAMGGLVDGPFRSMDISTIGALFIYIPLFMGMIAWAAFFAVSLLAIVIETAAGNDEVIEWPQLLDVTRWFGGVFYPLNALAVSAAPATCIVLLAGIHPVWLPLVTGMCVYLFGPPVLLSMLAAGSCFNLLSGETLHRMRRVPDACITFYAMTGVIYAVMLGASYALLAIHGKWPAFAVSFICVMAMFLNARLTGRLGWVLSQLPDETAEETGE